MADGTGRHGRPDDPDDVASGHGATGVTPTQPLPTVQREGSGPETPPVRAVAKRVPSALPALGRDEVSDLPHSARTSADRRRQAREDADGRGEPGSESPSADAADPPPLIVPRPRPEPEIERVPAPSTEVAAEVSADVELVPVGSRAREKPAAPPPAAAAEQAGPSGRHSSPDPAEPPAVGAGSTPVAEPDAPVPEAAPVAPVPASVAPERAPAGPERAAVGERIAPYARGGAAGVPSPPPSVSASPPSAVSPEQEPGRHEVIDATIVDESPRPYAATDTQTDEWLAVAPSAPEPPAPPAPPAGVPVGPPAGSPSALPRRAPGPAALATRPARMPPPPAPPDLAGRPDTWDTTPLPPVTDDYEGRRRRRRRRPMVSPWLVVLAVVVALSAAVALPFLFAGGGEADPDIEANPSPPTSDPVSSSPSGSSTGLPIIPAPPSVSATSSSTASATPTPSGSGASTAATTGPSTQTSTTVPNPPPPPPPTFSVALEAESGQRSGCAAVRSVDGATVVDRIGDENDWPRCWSDGVLSFDNVSLPAGTFTVTIYYVFHELDDDQSRIARLRIDPDGPGATVDQQHTYSRTTACCQTWTTGSFTVAAGTVDISFANPNLANGQDRAPALDRIVIQQTS